MTAQTVTTIKPNQSPMAVMASRLSIDENEVQSIITNTLMKAKGNNAQVSNEELVTFLAIANEYQLNPLSKEIYAFSNRGAIQPIVSIDGWLKIINGHPAFDGMEYEDSLDDQGQISAITCRIYRNDRSRPTEVTEYMSECRGTSEPWRKWPARMLRHKATIQGSRYAFGLSGIVDPDEAERIQSTSLKDVTPSQDRNYALSNSAGLITAEQVGKIRKALEVAGKSETQFCKRARISCVEELEKDRFDGAIKAIKKPAQDTEGGQS